MLTTLLFDLDGTLLDMDEEAFVPLYMKSVAKAMAKYGLDPQKMIQALKAGSEAMFNNNGPELNRDVLFKIMSDTFGFDIREYEDRFDDYYRTTFDEAAVTTHPKEGMEELLKHWKDLGYRLVLASNPVFPVSAMEERLKWAGIDPKLFDDISSYSTSTCSKRSPNFFMETAKRLGVTPEECMMIGNSVDEDGQAENACMQFWLQEGTDFSKLNEYLEKNAPANHAA